MIDDRFLPRVWTDEGYYYPIFSELGITYENKNLPFTKENLKDINWAFRWRFNHSNENVDMEYINTLEQCTGLKDKNGKLIYEGDIVLKSDVNAIGYSKTRVCKVHWHNDWLSWVITTQYGDTYKLLEFEPQQYEIISNIHENADDWTKSLIKVGGK